MKTPDHLSYDKYKKNKQTNPKRRFFLFIGTFIISLCAFLVIATLMAPDVDVTIGDEPELEEKNIGLGVKQFVDSRLKAIELDDMGKSTLTKPFEDEEKNNASEIEEEKIVLPEHKEDKEKAKTVTPLAPTEPAVMPAYEAPRPEVDEVVAAKPKPVATSSGMVKVYVGKYSNERQARVALDILMDSGLNVSPFVKNLNGVYTLQIGSFSDKSRATDIANELTRNGFPARLVQE